MSQPIVPIFVARPDDPFVIPGDLEVQGDEIVDGNLTVKGQIINGGGGGGGGTVTSIVAGNQLTGGTITTSGVIGVDPNMTLTSLTTDTINSGVSGLDITGNTIFNGSVESLNNIFDDGTGNAGVHGTLTVEGITILKSDLTWLNDLGSDATLRPVGGLLSGRIFTLGTNAGASSTHDIALNGLPAAFSTLASTHNTLDNGAGVLTTSVPGITTTGSPIAQFFAPNLSGAGVSLQLGVSNATLNTANIIFNYISSGNSLNNIQIGLAGANKIIVDGSGNLSLAGVLVSSSSTTGIIINPSTSTISFQAGAPSSTVMHFTGNASGLNADILTINNNGNIIIPSPAILTVGGVFNITSPVFNSGVALNILSNAGNLMTLFCPNGSAAWTVTFPSVTGTLALTNGSVAGLLSNTTSGITINPSTGSISFQSGAPSSTVLHITANASGLNSDLLTINNNGNVTVPSPAIFNVSGVCNLNGGVNVTGQTNIAGQTVISTNVLFANGAATTGGECFTMTDPSGGNYLHTIMPSLGVANINVTWPSSTGTLALTSQIPSVTPSNYINGFIGSTGTNVSLAAFTQNNWSIVGGTTVTSTTSVSSTQLYKISITFSGSLPGITAGVIAVTSATNMDFESAVVGMVTTTTGVTYNAAATTQGYTVATFGYFHPTTTGVAMSFTLTSTGFTGTPFGEFNVECVLP